GRRAGADGRGRGRRRSRSAGRRAARPCPRRAASSRSWDGGGPTPGPRWPPAGPGRGSACRHLPTAVGVATPGRAGTPWDPGPSSVASSGAGLLRLCLRLHLVVEADDAVGPAAAAVDGARLHGLLVDEEVERVADELHLVERLVDAHRLGVVQLLA